ncbi:MAG: hypothetical protein E7773_10900 [Sphingomonas sp.]|uniref:hypothetical protein n=1 Tax=Sphingomonas sp. TaxID=28214 RepID=UPI0012102561|nr:hypothetical protein [Sphingomonas sp.]THD35611.1 MAG: hypothetical protein E7773_10900 [Sphingomonas sp.]
MRFLLALIGLAAVVLIILLATGMVTLHGTAGTLPTVKVEGGKAPEVTANVATVTTGTTNVTVPTVQINKPGEAPPANSVAPK